MLLKAALASLHLKHSPTLEEKVKADVQVFVCFQLAESLGCFHHGNSGPTQHHGRISPSLHVATDPAHSPHHVLDRIGACERAPELCRQTEAIDSQHLVEPFEDAGGNSGCLMFEPAGEVA